MGAGQQGAVFRHSQGLEVGVNRLIRGPEGALYIGGIGGNGNWNWNDTRFGLQRLMPTDAPPAFEMHSMRATADGFAVRFTHPVAADWLSDPNSYALSQWDYEPTEEYGGPKMNMEPLAVEAAEIVDEQTVRLVVPGLKIGRCVALRCDPASATTGEPIRSPEAWYTLNTRPVAAAGVDVSIIEDIKRSGVGVGVLPPAHATPLVTGNAEPQWRRVGERGPSTAPKTHGELFGGDGFIEMNGGDRETMPLFGDARFHIEWYAPPGGSGQDAGNSGVFVQGLYEVQVLGTLMDDSLGGRPLRADEAGAIYGVKPADTNASNGPGQWQAYDIWFEAPRFRGDERISPARMTVFWNGELIHDRVKVAAATRGREGKDAQALRVVSASSHDDPGVLVQLGGLQLQDHHSRAEGPVRYRNVWLAALDAVTYTPTAWLDAFDGESLEGWTVVGGDGTYRVERTDEGPVIVGTSAPETPNTFLVLNRPIGDFELFVEVQQHERLNSGIQIRSHVDGGLTSRRGRLRGLQVELDPSDMAFTGGVYDEGRRGWIHPLTTSLTARRVYDSDEWNQIRVLAEGSRVRTWVNGIPAADVFDAVDASGHIALQVHGVGSIQEPMEVRWRNLRVRELSAMHGHNNE